MSEGRNVAFLGGGKMGEALVSGLIRSGARKPEELMVTCRREERARELAERHGVATGTNNREAAEWADTLVLTVKPQDMEALLVQISEYVRDDQLVISFAAGIRTSFIEHGLRHHMPVVRVMSNVAVLVDEAMSRRVSPGTMRRTAPGRGRGAPVLRRPGHPAAGEPPGRRDGDQRLRPAYFFLLAEAMIEACILLGLSRDVASDLIIQTMLGSALMLRDTGSTRSSCARW